MQTVHFIPVSSKDKVLKSLRESRHPVNKVFLILEHEAKAERIENALKALVEVEKIQVDSSKVYSSVLSIVNAISKELREGNKVVINLTDCSMNLAIACFIAAQLSESRLCIPDEILIPKLKKISKEKLSVLVRLEQEGGEIDSVAKLIDVLEGISGSEKEYLAQRAKIGYRLRELEELKLVKTQRAGKNLKIRLTELGRAYAVLADFLG
jgi:translation elongation factor EF-1beta